AESVIELGGRTLMFVPQGFIFGLGLSYPRRQLRQPRLTFLGEPSRPAEVGKGLSLAHSQFKRMMSEKLEGGGSGSAVSLRNSQNTLDMVLLARFRRFD